MNIDLVESNEGLARIKVIGVGGAGGNAINRMIEAGLTGVDFLAVNTDLQALSQSQAHQTVQIGSDLTRGLGSGGDPRVGAKAAEEDEERIVQAVQGADMVFVTAGMGGGTGTGAAPHIAAVARQFGILTVGIVTKPFVFEGTVRSRQAEEGLAELKESVDTLIVIPNQRLLEVVAPNTTFQEAFRVADNVLYEATRGIYEIIACPNHVNLDFADVRSTMKGMGVALMGTGRAEGEDRAVKAAEAAINSPLLEDVDIHGAQGVLVNLLGAEIGIAEISAAMSHVQDAAGSQAHIIFGYGTDESLGETLQVTVIATGFPAGQQSARRPVAAEPTRTVEQPAAVEVEEPEPVAPEEEASVAEAVEAVAEADTPWEIPEDVPEDVPAPAEIEIESAVEAEELEAPLKAMVASAGGPDTVAATVPTTPTPVSAPEHQETDTGLADFLTPVTEEVEAAPRPEPQQAPQPRPAPPRPGTGGFRSDELLGDLSEPAYTRKYMD